MTRTKKIAIIASIIIIVSVALFLVLDADGDGLNNLSEIRYGTSIFNSDTDSDGLGDADELNNYGTDPLNDDSDNDGLDDYKEINTYHTNPLLADTDFDSLTDYEEVVAGSDRYITDPTSNDTDADGLSDYEEFLNDTNPNNPDTDGDGLKDGEEMNEYNTDPTDSDSDDDDILDGEEIALGTDPLDDDTDDDGYLDGDDYVPTTDAKIRVSILKFKVIDEIDGWPDYDPNKALIYFEIFIDDMDNKVGRLPGEDVNASLQWDVTRGILITKTNQYVEHDIADNELTHQVKIVMYSIDLILDDVLDIDGHDSSKGLTLYYNIATGQWIGDDADGITDGSDDGTQNSDDDDAYLEYNITTV